MKSLLAYIPILLLAGCGTKTNPTDTWSKYVQIKIDWKNDLAELLLKHTPEHEELINIQRDLQIAYIKQRTIKYRFLQAKHKDLLLYGKGIVQHSNFEWSEKLDQHLLKYRPEYSKLKSKISSLEAKNQGHPQWPSFREKFKKISEAEDYKTHFASFHQAISQLDNEVKGG
jgi:hypothetical protein